MIATALALGTPFFVFFGWLSDRIGRKPIILSGCLLAALTYMPLFHALAQSVNPALAQAQAQSPATIVADPADCSVQFDPIGKNKFDRHSCDVVKAFVAKAGVSYANQQAPAGSPAKLVLGSTVIAAPDAATLAGAGKADAIKAFQDAASAGLKSAGYPAKADPAQINKPMAIAILFVLVLYVTMVYGPIAALLVEAFPARIRYTSMSLPYHIGNGWFGGFLPTIAFAIVAANGNIYAGLWYPIIVALLTVIVGVLFLREPRRESLGH
jgi:MFS family permease